MRRYWTKFKYNKTRREKLIEMFDASDAQIEYYYGEGFQGWREILDANNFLEELTLKKKKIDL